MQERNAHSGMNRFPALGYIASYLLALPVIVVAASSSGTASIVSGLLAVAWLVLAPLALYSARLSRVLPLVPAVFAALTLTLLPFDSAAFVVDVTATVVMFLGCFPRARRARTHATLLATSPARA
jgi:hypothetical protein